MGYEIEARWKVKNLPRYERILWKEFIPLRVVRMLGRKAPRFAGLPADAMRARMGPLLTAVRGPYAEYTIGFRKHGEEAVPERNGGIALWRVRIITHEGALASRPSFEYWVGWKSAVKSMGGVRRREEHEERVASCFDADDIIRNLRCLGWRKSFAYESERKDIRFLGAVVSFRRFPFIGEWIEIEGSIDAIFRAARILGLAVDRAVEDSWEKIFRVHCAKKGIAPRNMVFWEERQWRSKS